MTGEEQPNRFSRRSLTVRIIMLVYIASSDVPNEIFAIGRIIFSAEEKCVNLLTLRDGDLRVLESLGSDLSRKSECCI